MKRLRTEEVYDALTDDELFAALPLRLAQSHGARSTLIHWHFNDGSADIMAHSGYFTDAQLRDYALCFAPLDPWARATVSSQHDNVAVNLEDFVSPAEFGRSTFFNEYIRPMGDDTFRCMGIRAKSSFGSGMIAIQRGRDQESFTEKEVAGLQRDAVHLRRLLALRGKIAALERQAASLHSMLDHMVHAAILVRANGRIVEVNGAARSLLRMGDVVCLRSGTLEGANGHHHAVAAAVAAACDPHGPRSTATLLGRAAGGAAVMTAIPVRGAGGERQALLLVQALPVRDDNAAVRLRELFHLSAAEADIAALIGEGASLEEIAQRRHVSIGTVRAQLKSLFVKLGCSRQSEVTAMVRSILPVPA